MRHSICLLALLGVFTPSISSAADLWWDGGSGEGLQTGDAAWGTAVARWATSSNPGAGTQIFWSNSGNRAIFEPNGPAFISVQAPVSVEGIIFNGTGYEVGGNSFTLTAPEIQTNASATISTIVGGSVGLTKTGSGTLTFWMNAVHSYTGATSISQGTLALRSDSFNNLLPTGSPISIASGATLDSAQLPSGSMTLGATQLLSGSGSVRGGLSAPSGSTIAPGNSAGQLSFIGPGNVTLNDGANLELELGSNATPGTTFDKVLVNDSGAKVFTPGSATLKLIGVSGVAPGVPYVIVEALNSATIASSSYFKNVGGTVMDSEATTYNQNGMSFNIAYSSSAITVTFSAVPEPTGLAMLLGAGSLLLRGRKRRAC